MAVVRVQDGTASKGMFLQVMKCGKREKYMLKCYPYELRGIDSRSVTAA